MTGLVFEDAPSGIRSGRTAGCKTVAFLTSHSREQVQAAEPDFIVNDMSWYIIPLYFEFNLQTLSTVYP